MGEKVNIINNSKNTVVVRVPYMHLDKRWAQKGARNSIDIDILKDAIFDPGFEYMLKSGILSIESKAARVELGLEEEEEEDKKVSPVFLSDSEKDLYLSNKKQGWEFKKILESLSLEGRRDLYEYMVEKEIFDSKKASAVKEICGFDVLRAIQNKHLNEE